MLAMPDFRRFGKSFAVKMLCAYYDKSRDIEASVVEEIKQLFPDVKIKQYTCRIEKCKK